MLMMTAFGLGTIPAMMLVPSLLQKMTASFRTHAMRVAAAIIIAMGIVTILRDNMVMPT